jgi:uncharacterized coiled-coil protein SlyX
LKLKFIFYVYSKIELSFKASMLSNEIQKSEISKYEQEVEKLSSSVAQFQLVSDQNESKINQLNEEILKLRSKNSQLEVKLNIFKY